MADQREDSAGRLQEFADDRFERPELIGEGNNATISLAWDRDVKRPVALKVSTSATLLDALGVERVEALGIGEELQQLVDEIGVEAERRYTLLREARLLGAVSHPNVIPMYEVGVLRGAVTIVMPFLSGGSLAEREFTGPWEGVLAVAMQIGEGLAALHREGIIHRDFKPNNVLFDGAGWPYVMDFGLACQLTDTEALTEWCGTARYMAPEVIDQHFRDERDDLYAFCTVAFEMFYGYLPFASERERRLGRVTKIERADGMSDAVRDVFVKGLQPDADDRWPNMRALLEALDLAANPVRRPRWPWVAAAISIALATGVSTSNTAEADECSEVAEELAPVWNKEVQAELRTALGTRLAGDALASWAQQWMLLRAGECHAAKLAGRAPEPSACALSLRRRFEITVEVLSTPHLRQGLRHDVVISELPAPKYCVDHPDVADSGQGGLLELRDLDVRLGTLIDLGELDIAWTTQAQYLPLAQTHSALYDTERAIFWRGELRRLGGDLDGAEEDFGRAFRRAQVLGADVFAAEAVLKLVMTAGDRGTVEAIDSFALVALGMFERADPTRIVEVHEVHGLALLAGDEATRLRAVDLLRKAVESREDQQVRQGGTTEPLSRAHESLGRGLLAVNQPHDALDYFELSLDAHRLEYGEAGPRVHGLTRQLFLAQLDAGLDDDVILTQDALLAAHWENGDWESHGIEAQWLAGQYILARQPEHARYALLVGLQIAREHGFVDQQQQLTGILETLAFK